MPILSFKRKATHDGYDISKRPKLGDVVDCDDEVPCDAERPYLRHVSLFIQTPWAVHAAAARCVAFCNHPLRCPTLGSRELREGGLLRSKKIRSTLSYEGDHAG